MIELKRTTSEDNDFISLVRLLDEDLAIRNGSDHPFYAQFNKIDKIRHVILYYDNGKPVGCAAFKEFNENTVEIKRMFVLPEYRSNGIGATILQALELWAGELNYSDCVLETGRKQTEAIRLYQKCGYELIPNFGPYIQVENSLCMKKPIM